MIPERLSIHTILQQIKLDIIALDRLKRLTIEVQAFADELAKMCEKPESISKPERKVEVGQWWETAPGLIQRIKRMSGDCVITEINGHFTANNILAGKQYEVKEIE